MFMFIVICCAQEWWLFNWI